MNCPTASCTTSAAAPRTGQGESALPRPDSGAKTQSLPFAALPHDLRKDPRLRGKDKAILLAAALLECARTQPSCSPTNARLAQDLGCCEQTVRTALAHLQDAGWIRIVLGANQPNGRTIWLLWRGDQIPQGAAPRAVPRQVSDTPQPVGPLPQPAGPPPQPIGPKVRRGEPEERNVTDSIPPRDHQSTVPPAPLPHPQSSSAPPSRLVTAPPPPTVPATRPQRALTPNQPDPARGPLKDALKALPRASPDQVRQSAWRLAHYLADTASIGFFLNVLGLVSQGLTPVERLLAAFTAADRSQGKARKPGAIFAVTWASWEPAPKPSEINRPVYHQVAGRASPVVPPPAAPEVPLSLDEEVAQLREWLAQPRHPCHKHARCRLAELGVGT